MSDLFVCGFGTGEDECTCKYVTKSGLKQHQRKKHQEEYAKDGFKMRGAKKARLVSPVLTRIEPLIPTTVAADPNVEVIQITIANTRVALEDQIELLKEQMSSRFRAINEENQRLAVQLADVNQRLKKVTKKSQKWCVICFERENDYAFLPCAHKCMCQQCAQITMRNQGVCPYCRVKISSVKRIFEVSADDT